MNKYNITNQFYINENIDLACEITGLSQDELESIVGRFTNRSHRSGKLKGKVVVKFNKIEIRKCFGNKLLWNITNEEI